jgi:peptidoglycan/xylan/chitin deacetylase (PgdA/CDA1 family)
MLSALVRRFILMAGVSFVGGCSAGHGLADGAVRSDGAADVDATGGSPGAPPDGRDGGGGATVTWPDGALAAVSLTYDDGLDSQLATVAPLLDAKGIKATFFLSSFEGVDHQWALPNLTDPLTDRHRAWQAVLARGHEIAGHTVNHPCNSPSKAAGYHLTDYTMARMAAELDDDIARMRRLGAVPPFTFAYPCMSDLVGIGPAGQDFSPLIAERFVAARVSASDVADPRTVDPLHVPQLDTAGKTGAELVAMVDEAVARRGWLVLLFHGVGSDQTCGTLAFDPAACTINYLTTSAAAHEALVNHLDQVKATVWTASFGQVAQHLR